MTPEEIKSRFDKTVLSAEEINEQLHIKASPEGIADLFTFLRDDASCQFNYPGDLTARDTGEELLLWYRLYSLPLNRTALVTVSLPRLSPLIQSVTSIWPGMNWHERECFDMYGISFDGHPDSASAATMRILLPEDWEGHPFRKDYTPEFSGNPLHGPQQTN